jgi:hypothetical protein
MSIAAETNLWPLAAVLPRVVAAEEGDTGTEDDREAEALALGERWQEELDEAVTAWGEQVSPEIYAAAVELVEDAVKADDVEALASLTVPVLGVGVAFDHMRIMYAEGADFVVAEAADAGVKIKPAKASLAWQPMNSVGEVLANWALAIAIRIGGRTTAGLSNEALRLYRPGVSAAQVTDGLQNYWDGLTDAVPRESIGAGLSRAVNLGKLDTYAGAKPRGWRLELVADERLDKNTCEPCRKIDGEVLPDADAAGLAYGGAGYLFCKGRERCRGTVRGVWTNKAPKSDFDLATLLDRMKEL